MAQLPTWRGREPDLIKFSFSGAIELEDDEPHKVTLATIGIGEEVDVSCLSAVAGHSFSLNNDDELVLTVKMKMLDCQLDMSGLPDQN